MESRNVTSLSPPRPCAASLDLPTFTDVENAVVLVNSQCQVIYASQEFARIWGYSSPEQIIGGSVVNLWSQDENAENAKNALQEKGEWRGELCAIDESGDPFMAEVSFNLLRDEFSEIKGVVTFVNQVRKAGEFEAREAAYLQRLKRLTTWGMRLRGEPGDIFVNAVGLIGELFEIQFASVCKVQDERLFFKACYRDGVVVAESGSVCWEGYPCGEVVRRREVMTFHDVLNQFPNAELIKDFNAYSYCGFPVLDEQGRVSAVLCLLDNKPHSFTCEDLEILRVIGDRIGWELEREDRLAAQWRAEQSVRASEQFTRAVFDTMPLNVAVLSETGELILMNQAWRDVARQQQAAWQSAAIGDNFLQICLVA